MMDGLILFSDFTASGVRSVVCLFLIFRLLSARKPEWKSIAAVLAGSAAVSVILSVTELPDYYRMALEIILIFVCAGYFQKADTRMSLFIGIFYEIAVSFWQFLFAACYSVLQPFLIMKRETDKLQSGVSICY